MKKLLVALTKLFRSSEQSNTSIPSISRETSRGYIINTKTPREIAEETGVPIIIERHYASQEAFDADHKEDERIKKYEVLKHFNSELYETNVIAQKLLEEAYILISSSSESLKTDDWKKDYQNYLFSRIRNLEIQ